MPILFDDLNERIAAEVQDDELNDFRDEINKLVRNSRKQISKSYHDWDEALNTYQLNRKEDDEDRKASRKKQPVKLVVPLTRAQIQTFVTFSLLLYTQNEQIFTCDPTGNEDFQLRDVVNKLLRREERNTRLYNKLFQFLLDIGRFNIGVLKTTWKFETYKYETEVVESTAQGAGNDLLTLATSATKKLNEVTKYEGNYVENVMPYNFFWDTSLPQTRWKEGAFAADETQYTLRQLKNWERSGFLHGVKFLDKLSDEQHRTRGETRLPSFGEEYKSTGKEIDDKNFPVVLTTVYYRCVPADFGLGDDEEERLLEIRIANDNRILSIEHFNAVHCDFPYDVGSMSPDHMTDISDSLSKLIDPLQEVVTWLFNSRIASVRTNLQGRVIMDPRYIEVEDFQTGAPYIRAKKAAPPIGLDKFVSQLKTIDTTQGHLNDAKEVMSIVQMMTGVNENAMGQFHGGRRSATEARAVNMGAAARMKVETSNIWHMAVSPCGAKLKKNLRQELSFEKFVEIVGQAEPGVELLYQQFHPEDVYTLISAEDFFVEDSTTATEKGYVAQSLQELLIAVISNPMIMQIMPVDLKAMLGEIQSLRGVKNLSRFFIQDQNQLAQLQDGLNRIQPPGPTNAPNPDSGVPQN